MSAEDAVRTLLARTGATDLDRVSLEKTPKRVVASIKHQTNGYAKDPHAILRAAKFDVDKFGTGATTTIEVKKASEDLLSPKKG